MIKGPLVMTQQGKKFSAPLDVKEYENFQEKHSLLSDMHKSISQIENNQGIEHDDAKSLLLQNVKK